MLKLKCFLVLVTIELLSKVDTSGIAWEFVDTECKSLPNLSVGANRAIKKNCVLAIGQTYTLNCLGGNNGWASNYLIIENSRYCEHSVSDTTVNITITG